VPRQIDSAAVWVACPGYWLCWPRCVSSIICPPFVRLTMKPHQWSVKATSLQKLTEWIIDWPTRRWLVLEPQASEPSQAKTSYKAAFPAWSWSHLVHRSPSGSSQGTLAFTSMPSQDDTMREGRDVSGDTRAQNSVVRQLKITSSQRTFPNSNIARRKVHLIIVRMFPLIVMQ
jgi:hypothetical protein